MFSQLMSTRQFLFSKSAPHTDDNLDRLVSLPGSDPLAQAFPDVRVGEAFIAEGDRLLTDWDSFGVLVMRIELNGEEDQLEQHRLALARVLDSLCSVGAATWGLLDPLHLACFLPGTGRADYLEDARMIQMSLASDGGRRVTFGVASFPTIDYSREEILDNAFKALDHAELLGPGSRVAFDAVSLNISGDKLYEAGNVEGALAEYQKGLLLDPDNLNLHNSLGVCYGVQGDLDRALEEFSTAMRLDADEVMAVYNTGLTHSLRKETDKGLAHLKKAVQIDDGVFEVCLELGRVYLEAGDGEVGQRYLQKARELRPESPTALFYLGECHSAAGRQKEAVAAYQAAIKFDPNSAAALSALGWLYECRGENREIGLMFCEQSVQIAPDNPLYQYRLGRLYLNHGRRADAEAALKTAADLGYDVGGSLEAASG
jgi:tetratricopeptide (TPR) repeat protein